MINFQLFPRYQSISPEFQDIVDVFVSVDKVRPAKQLESNEMLALLRPGLEALGYSVEKSKKAKDLILVPVLFGENNKYDKAFCADALSKDHRIVMEVEAGRALANYQFLKDIFEACMMYEVEHLVIAVLNQYIVEVKGKKTISEDFQKIKTFLETLYTSNRLHLPLKSILLIGY
jgi:hypothetical protein